MHPRCRRCAASHLAACVLRARRRSVRRRDQRGRERGPRRPRHASTACVLHTPDSVDDPPTDAGTSRAPTAVTPSAASACRRPLRVDDRRRRASRRATSRCRSTTPHPDAGTVHAVPRAPPRRATARTRIGTLLVNPGGPGFGGSSLADDAANDLRPGRCSTSSTSSAGTHAAPGSASRPSTASTTTTTYFATRLVARHTEPSDRRSSTAAKEFARGVRSDERRPARRTSARPTPPATWTRSAQALGEETISYFGFSYGSELGAHVGDDVPGHGARRGARRRGRPHGRATSHATMQQAHRVRGDARPRSSQRAAPTRPCAFHNGGDAEGAFDRLQRAAVEPHPVADKEPDRPPVTPGGARHRGREAMYDQSLWPQLEQALADLRGRRRHRRSSTSTTSTTATPTAPGTTGWRRTSRSAASTTRAASARRRVRPRGRVRRRRAAARPQLARRARRSAPCGRCTHIAPVAITGTGAGPDRRRRHDRRSGDAARRHAHDGRRTLEDGHLVVVHADQHTGYGVNDVRRRRRRRTTSSTPRRHCGHAPTALTCLRDLPSP